MLIGRIRIHDLVNRCPRRQTVVVRKNSCVNPMTDTIDARPYGEVLRRELHADRAHRAELRPGQGLGSAQRASDFRGAMSRRRGSSRTGSLRCGTRFACRWSGLAERTNGSSNGHGLDRGASTTSRDDEMSNARSNLPLTRRDLLIAGAASAATAAAPDAIAQPASQPRCRWRRSRSTSTAACTSSSSTPAPPCSTPCASGCTSPAARRAATRASAAPAPCIVDGRRVTSCLTLAVMQQGHKITTIEGLGTPDKLHPMQAAFVKHDGFQCGFCTPGPDLLGGRHARGGEGRRSEPRHRRPDAAPAAHRTPSSASA